jgi:hypothetical protein
LRTFCAALGNDQTRFYRLAQADFVRKDAAAFTQAAQREDNRVDLVWIGIDARLALGRGVSFPVVRPANPDEIFSQNALLERGHVGLRRGVVGSLPVETMPGMVYAKPG